MTPEQEAKLQKLGQAFLDAGYEYWLASLEAGQWGAVKWVQSTSGEVCIFTRGEYRETLMSNIPMASDVHYFKPEESE